MKNTRYTRAAMVLALVFAVLAIGLLPLSNANPPTAAAAQQAAGTASSPTWPRPEVLVLRLYFHDRAERDRLAMQWNAEEVSTLGGYLTIWADRATYNEMLAQHLQIEIDQETTRQANSPTLFAGPQAPNTFYGGYKTVEDMQAYLDAMVATYPTLAAKVDIGGSWCTTHTCTQPNSYAGYRVYALHITNQAVPGPKPVFWYDAGIHAREIATPEIAMRLISWLL
ncbi:MAG TPA: M14 family zinc carboxypeptidase, partial [Chloroflexia bacterium]|nr:M14 family zinc carboxypeptidase [Chloroflexia bacterium]